MSGATSFTSVPIVDISGLRSPDRAERERVAAEIGKAAREVGFLYVSGAGVDDALFERMLAATKEFFALPLEEKMRCYIGLSKCHRGYVPVGRGGPRDRDARHEGGVRHRAGPARRRPRLSGGQPDARPEHMAGPAGLRRRGDRLLPRGARRRPPAAVGVRGGARRGSRHVLASTPPRRRASCG